jgi:hypothetical protein
MNPRPIFRLVGVVCSAVCLASCFTTTADFKSDAETFIAEQVPPAVETTFTSVNCDAPIDQNIGTRFACQAIDADGGVWEFDNVIDAEGEFTVNISRRP